MPFLTREFPRKIEHFVFLAEGLSPKNLYQFVVLEDSGI